MPIDKTLGFEPTKRAISRIAKEGRKYGVSLCIVTQRPAELDPTILSQCNTIFSMRLTNERDQEILRAGISDAAASLLEFMTTMGTGEAITFGEGVALPTRIKFDMLPADALPEEQHRLVHRRTGPRTCPTTASCTRSSPAGAPRPTIPRAPVRRPRLIRPSRQRARLPFRMPLRRTTPPRLRRIIPCCAASQFRASLPPATACSAVIMRRPPLRPLRPQFSPPRRNCSSKASPA